MTTPTDNLTRLHAALDAEGLRQADVVHILIGYVAGLVPADEWDKGLAFALQTARERVGR